MSHGSILSVAHWESFYRSGALAACPTGPAGTYTLELRDLWVNFFSQLPEGARLLDLGTGNGAIPLIAKETATLLRRTFDIHGADLARIDPPAHVPNGVQLFAGITFHPGVCAEELPFRDGAFAAVSGQYSLEYTDVPRSLREILRVLQLGAAAVFVTHHADSIVVERARGSMEQAELVLGEVKIYRKLRRFLDAARSSPSAAAHPWRQLSAGCDLLRQAVSTASDAHVLDVTLDAVAKLLSLRNRLSRAELEREVSSVEAELRDHVRRLKDLLAVALDATGMEGLVAKALMSGFADVRFEPVRHSADKLVGWHLRMRRPS